MSKQKEVIAFEPQNELSFPGPYDAPSMSSLKMTNLTEKKVHFKLKTTAPKNYLVRPNSGVMQPKETVVASIVLQPMSSDLDEKQKHKFMIMYIVEPEDCTMTTEQLWSSTDVNDVSKHKLKCVFESSIEPVVNTTAAVKVEATNTLKDIKALTDEIKKMREEESVLRKEHADMKKELDKLGRLLNSARCDDSNSTVRSVALTIFIAILCYVLGKLF